MSSNKIKVDKEDVSEVKIETFSYNWKIKNFGYLHKKLGESVKSPVFTIGTNNKINWQLELYPNGHEKETENYMSLFLLWQHNSIVKGEYKLSLIDNEQKKQKESIGQLEKKQEKDRGYGFPRFIMQKDLNKSTFLPNDCLTIHCEIALSLGDVNPIIEKTKRKLEVSSRPSWFKKLFLEESLSDIKMITIPFGKSLPAHRSVLAACSPVFKAMFTHDMLEKKLGEVKIADGEYEVVKEMLRFIYLDEVMDLKSNVFKLVKLAQKYQIDGLVELCEQTLMDQISVDNVLKISTLADSYNMGRLKTRTLDFGSLHLKEVVNSNDFKSSKYPQAMQSILETLGKQ